MRKLFTIVVSLFAIVTLPLAARAADHAVPARTDAYWTASYWNNISLSGPAALSRLESAINYNWGFGAPDYTINTDQFSARWSRVLSLSAGVYRFSATSDDGVRVSVDGQWVINDWTGHPAKTFSADRTLSAGDHLIIVEYYEDSGSAQMVFNWEQVYTSPDSWRGEYYNNTTLGGPAVLVREDANIAFNWQNGSPAPNVINNDYFSVRWTRTLSLQPGWYRFRMTVDDGARVWVNDQLVLDAWQVQPAQTREATLYIPTGTAAVRMEYFEASGNAVAYLAWDLVSAPSTGPVNIRNWRGEYFNNAGVDGPAVLVRDDEQINFNWADASPAPGIVNSDNFSVRWTRTLDLPAGSYRFTLTADDGARLWVNDTLVLDHWQTQAQQTYVTSIYLPGGLTRLRMEYFDSTGFAVAALSWDQPTTTIVNWRGEYFNNTALSGPAALVRDDAAVNFNWGAGSPVPGTVNSDGFAVRWTRALQVPAGKYRFTVTADDGARLWVNDQLVIDAWRVQPPTTYAGDVTLPDGAARIRLEYFDDAGNAQVKLDWVKAPDEFRYWKGEYFNNMNLTGAPVLVRDDAAVNFDWDVGSPAPGVVGIDAFSARWTRTVAFTPGWYRFTLVSDDGSRLTVNNQALIDAWQVQVAQRYTADVYLSGSVPVKLEYYENSGLAQAHLTWEPVAATVRNWRGEYFNNMTLSGPSALVRDDADINFNWADASPAPGVVNDDNFSVRWTRKLDLPAGWYRFTFIVDDGARLWVNNQLLIDAWQIQGPRPYDGEIYLPGGPVDVKMEYFENTGWATAQLAWQAIPQATIPQTVVVDDGDAGFVRMRGTGDWNTAPEGYDNRLTWTRNTDSVQPASNVGRWTSRLAPGRYEVFAYIPERYTTTGQARYVISSSTGTTVRLVSQSANGNRWVSLGVYTFQGTADDYVELSDATLETNATTLVAFDAMRWEPR